VGFCLLKISFNYSAAQSFRPQKEILTRVELNMSRMSTAAYPCIVAIRDNLTGANLAEIALDPGEFSIVDGMDMNLTWTGFDFEDLRVTVNETYYIVAYTTGISGNLYFWSGLGDMANGPYPDGMMYLSEDGGGTWDDYPMSDTCFRTYGDDDQAPTVKIENPARGYIHFLGIPIIQRLLPGLIADAIGLGRFGILGPVTVNVSDDFDSDEDLTMKVFIDGVEADSANITYCPDCGLYKWQWPGPATGILTLKITAEDSYGNTGYDEMTVLYVCLM